MSTAGYTTVPLRDAATLINGDRGQNYPARRDMCDHGVPFINAGHLGDGSLQWADMNYISREQFSALRGDSVRSGDILYCLRGSLGKMAFIERIECGAIASSLVIVRARPNANARYLFHFLASEAGQQLIKKYDNGAAQPNLSARSLGQFDVPLPPLPEQKRIAAILDKADAIRRKRQEAIRLTEELLRSAFLEMFGDPVTNPKGWEVKKLGEVATITTGNTPPRVDEANFGDAIEWIKTDNINTPNHYLTRSTEGLSEGGLRLGRRASKGSTLVTCIAGSANVIGNVAMADRDVAFNQQINAVTPGAKLNSFYLYGVLLLSKKGVQRLSTGGMKGLVSKGRLSKLTIPVAPLDRQARFAQFFSNYVDASMRQAAGVASAATMQASLTQSAFSGRL